MTAQLLIRSSPPPDAAGVRVPVPGRTLHLIDIENLVAGRPTRSNLTTAWASYQRHFRIPAGDQVRIACAKPLAAMVAFTIPTGRQLLIGPATPDGADHALIDSVDPAFTATRFDAVVIASSDHIFAPLAAALAGAGCPVTIAHIGPCSTALQLAGSTLYRLHYRLGPANSGR